MFSNMKCVILIAYATMALISLSSSNAYQTSIGVQCSRLMSRENLHLRGGASRKKSAEDDQYKVMSKAKDSEPTSCHMNCYVQDIQAPKRALSAYMLFANEVRADVVKKNPEMKMTEISKIIGDKWKALSADGKKKFENEAAKLKTEYEKEKAEYEAKVRDKVKTANPDLTFAELGKKIAEEWNGMSAQQKEVYEKESAKLKEKYQVARAKYDAEKPEEPAKEKTLKKSKTSSSKSSKPEKKSKQPKTH
eukprot:758684-Hanusia_phi.AAC.1